MNCWFLRIITPPLLLAAHAHAEGVSIESLVSKASATHPEVRFYEAEIAAAKGAHQTAATRPNPELETSLGTWRVNDFGSKSDGPAWAVTLSQQFEWPGRVALRKAIASKQVDVAELGLAQFKTSLAGKVRSAAWALLAARQKLESTERVSARLTDLAKVLMQRDPTGPAPKLEARIIQATALTMDSDVITARREMAEAGFVLNQLMGEKPDHTIEPNMEKLSLADAPALESLLAEARKNNFDLRARMLDVEQQGFMVKLTENERWPAFKVSPYVQQQQAGSKETQFGIGVSIPLPLFDRNKGNVAAAKARQVQAEIMLAAQMRELERAVAVQRSNYASYRTALAKWADGTLEEVSEAAKEADEHYRLGALPLSTYIELQKQYLEAQQAMLANQLGALEAKQQIEILTGHRLEVRQ